MPEPLRLHYAPDNASLIIRLALEELRLPYRAVLVDRAARAQRGAAYLRLNPAGRIPTLETPQGPISETGAILLWLADRHDALAPGPDAAERGAFLNWLFFTANTLHPDVIALFYAHRYGPASALPDIAARTRRRIARHLTLIEAQAHRGHGWLCGDAPSVLDFYLCAILRWLALYPVDGPRWFALADHPALAALCRRIEARPAAHAVARAEGLGDTPFSAPVHPEPPEGSAV